MNHNISFGRIWKIEARLFFATVSVARIGPIEKNVAICGYYVFFVV